MHDRNTKQKKKGRRGKKCRWDGINPIEQTRPVENECDKPLKWFMETKK